MTDSNLICPLCGKPSVSAPRVRDARGRVFHRACYEAAKSRRAAGAATPMAAEKGMSLTPLPAAPAKPSPAIDLCPSCAAPLPAQSVLCTQCGFDRRSNKRMATNVDDSAPKPRRKPSVVREFGVFGLGYGLLLVIFGIVGAQGPAAQRGDAYGRVVVILSMIALIVPGLMNIVGGILAFARPSTMSVYLCMAGSLILPIAYFGIPITMGIAPGFNCMTILLIVIPLTVIKRAALAIEEIKGRPK